MASAPDDGDLRCLYAQALLLDDQPGAALESADAALALLPEDPWPRRLRSAALSDLGRHAAAIMAAADGVRLAPASAEAHLTHGRAYFAAGRPGMAKEAAERAQELAPGRPATEELIGLALLELGRPADAEVRFRRVLELDPQSPSALNNLGVCLSQQGRAADSAELYARAASGDPRNPLFRKNAGSAAHTIGVQPWARGRLMFLVGLVDAGIWLVLHGVWLLVYLEVTRLAVFLLPTYAAPTLARLRGAPPGAVAALRDRRRIRAQLAATNSSARWQIGLNLAIPLLAFVLDPWLLVIVCLARAFEFWRRAVGLKFWKWH